jgi:hypothetical protein
MYRASYGTTKYCTYYLRNLTCPNPSCLYLHEPGEDADTISKEELATGKHRMRDQISHDNPEDDEGSSPKEEERSALPATASWGKSSTPGTPTIKNSGLPDRALTPDAFGPPLAVAVAQQQQQQQQQQKQLSPTVLKRKLEKKKRKELLRQKKEEEPKKLDFVSFVLGDAFDQLNIDEEEEETLGVSALHGEHAPSVVETTPFLNLNGSSPLEFLTHSIPTPTYTGTFNPFSHQLLQPSLFDSSARKTSRFGFAQF